MQDPYCLRCQPQVMGAVLDVLRQAATLLATEANGVSDNPLIFPETDEALSGGNFHAEPVAFAADMIAMAVCEIGSLAERRIAMLVDPALSGLPAFLTPKPGLNSGFMIPQVTAAALVSENKQRAYPASVDSIPTSANQEDHVSMAAHGARRLLPMVENAMAVIGIELLAAAQGCDFHAPLTSSTPLEAVRTMLRATRAAPRRRPLHAPRHGGGDRAGAGRGSGGSSRRRRASRNLGRTAMTRPAWLSVTRARRSADRQPAAYRHGPDGIGAAPRLAVAGAQGCGLVDRPALRLRRRARRDHGAHGNLAHGDRREPRSLGRIALSRAGDDGAVPARPRSTASRSTAQAKSPATTRSPSGARVYFDPYHAALQDRDRAAASPPCPRRGL